MTRIVALLAAVAGITLAASLPVEGAGKYVTVPAKHGKCKKGYKPKIVKKRKHGKVRRVKVCVKRRRAPVKTTTTTTTTGATTTPTNGTTTTTTGQTTLPQSATSTRDDAAAQAAMQNAFASLGGVLPLERYASMGSVTMTIHRAWFWANGQYKFAAVDWMQAMGEKCSTVQTGTWTFKEGYRITLADGRTGIIAKLTIALDAGQVGEDIIGALDSDSSYVYVGPNLVQYTVNPNMLNGC